jgi:hypothetical protein
MRHSRGYHSSIQTHRWRRFAQSFAAIQSCEIPVVRRIFRVSERAIQLEASHCGELDFGSVPDQDILRSMKPF